ncbi:DNA-binding MarR family transcriptional regulator [Rhodococcus fascians]|uniref:MarR family winged helix-turn-helix transcriptional regulator n=1 Tax=Nocardiaceae TaxID=85025 RepID=UPI002859157F|nr:MULTISPECIES: MarR family transcriptional regulator [Rhodococcus]MDR6912932.1 DNA-binding MarR family transcriptional regulator [Rhodococcus sp. 3258]MDR6934529.1 DNA-binding MarR family transcriptional regulator [Rhodococcus fascians]
MEDNTSLADRWLALVRACEASTAKIERVLARDHHLCVSAYQIMEKMNEAGTWVRVPDLTHTVSRSQPQISRLVTQMLDAGYIDRERDPSDARGSRIRLNANGEHAFRKAAATVDTELRQVVDEDQLLTPFLGTRSLARDTIGH